MTKSTSSPTLASPKTDSQLGLRRTKRVTSKAGFTLKTLGQRRAFKRRGMSKGSMDSAKKESCRLNIHSAMKFQER